MSLTALLPWCSMAQLSVTKIRSVWQKKLIFALCMRFRSRVKSQLWMLLLFEQDVQRATHRDDPEEQIGQWNAPVWFLFGTFWFHLTLHKRSLWVFFVALSKNADVNRSDLVFKDNKNYSLTSIYSRKVLMRSSVVQFVSHPMTRPISPRSMLTKTHVIQTHLACFCFEPN